MSQWLLGLAMIKMLSVPARPFDSQILRLH